jgi:hypothetical protein
MDVTDSPEVSGIVGSMPASDTPTSRLFGAVRADMSRARIFTIVAAPLFVLYLATATWTVPYNMDALTNVLAAAEIAYESDPFLEEHEVLADERYQGYAAWVVAAGDTAASKYPPGAAALAVPFYKIWPEGDATADYSDLHGEIVELPIPSLFPAAMTSAAVGAITVGLLALAFARLADSRLAVAGAYVAGLGTGIWTVASDSLWQHGPAMMWIAAGTLLSASHGVWSGFGFGAAVLTRPHTGVVAACNGLWLSWQRRSIVPALKTAIGVTIGLAGVVAYNNYVFGSTSIAGGYSSKFGDRLLSLNVLEFLGNVILALVHPMSGLLVYTPFLILLFPGLRAGWRAAPAWVRGSAVGGLVYILIQWKANRYSGGGGFWGYRYPLEALAAGAPLLFLSYTEWVQNHSSDRVRKAFRYLLILTIEFTALGALYISSIGSAIFG